MTYLPYSLVAVVDADNDCTGTQAEGNYNVRITGPVHGGGIDEWADVPKKVLNVDRRRGYFAQACGTLAKLQHIDTKPLLG